MTETNTRTGRTLEAFKQSLVDNLYYSRGQAAYGATLRDAHVALAYTVRDHLIERWRKTVDAHFEANPKVVYYLSAEYLLGRQLTQNLLYTGTWELAREALAEYDLDLEQLIELDAEPGLGNGGLGRLAACFIDSLATLDVPCVGYGIRYEFGIFRQSFKDGWQVESPDYWLHYGNPWEFPQPDDMVAVSFGGHTEQHKDEKGDLVVKWVPAMTVFGEPYHTLVPGYGTETVNVLRLWRARASEEFDFQLFDDGDYARAVEQKVYSENITKVLYPNDDTPQGKELRLKQQYFFVACSLQDIIRRFRALNDDWSQLPRQGRHPAQRYPSRSSPSQSLCDSWWTNTELGGTRRGTSPGGPVPIPAIRCCRRRWRNGRWTSLGTCCPGIWRSSTRSTTASLKRYERSSRMTKGGWFACPSSRRGRSGKCAWPIWPVLAAFQSMA